MPDKLNPDDINAAEEDITAELSSATVRDVLLAVEDIQLTIESLVQFMHNVIRIALLAGAVFLMSCALAVMIP